MLVRPERLEASLSGPTYPGARVPQEAGRPYGIGQPQLLQQRFDAGMKGLSWPVTRETGALDEGDGQAPLRADNRRRAAGWPAAENDDPRPCHVPGR